VTTKRKFLDQFSEWERLIERDVRLCQLVPLEHDLGALDLAAAADAASLQTSSFSRYFHEKVGACFRDWRTALKVSRALELLQATDRTVETIALAVGFRDGRSLRRAMNRYVGLSPGDFRASEWSRAGSRTEDHSSSPSQPRR
jgi:transcriptional regulator GlxA family with amidase domain